MIVKIPTMKWNIEYINIIRLEHTVRLLTRERKMTINAPIIIDKDAMKPRKKRFDRLHILNDNPQYHARLHHSGEVAHRKGFGGKPIKLKRRRDFSNMPDVP